MADETPKPDEVTVENLQKFGARYYGRYSTFWGRLAAGILDALVLGFVLFSVGSIFGMGSKTARYFSDIFPYVYSVVSHGKYGRTIGKKLMGLKVIDKSEQQEIGYRQAFIRDAFPISITLLVLIGSSWGLVQEQISFVNSAWFVLEVVTVLFNQKRRAFHDYIAGTVVVKA